MYIFWCSFSCLKFSVLLCYSLKIIELLTRILEVEWLEQRVCMESDKYIDKLLSRKNISFHTFITFAVKVQDSLPSSTMIFHIYVSHLFSSFMNHWITFSMQLLIWTVPFLSINETLNNWKYYLNIKKVL